MKHSEFRAFQESPIRIALQSVEENQALPAVGTFIENYGDDNEHLAEFSATNPRIWRAKSKLPDRYLDRRTLYSIAKQDPKNEAVIVYPVPVQQSFLLDEPQSIALDDRAIEDLKQRIPDLSRATDEEICDWIAQEFILDPLRKNGNPVLCIGLYARETEYERAGGFSIIGRSFLVGLRRTNGDNLMVERFRKRTRKIPHLAIWEGLFSFTLNTQAAKIKSPAFQQQFEERRLDPLAFLNIWDRYLDLDTTRLARKKEEAGSLVYHGFKALKEGSRVQIFNLKKGEGPAAQNFVDVLKDFSADDQNVGIEGSKQSKEGSTIIFKFIKYDERLKTFHLEQTKERNSWVPKNGIIILSLHGWKIANERRSKAFKRIRDERCDISSLYYHLYEKQLPIKERRPRLNIKASEIARAFGNDSPNQQQRQAIKVCLESPDIALIQGPPGTGKTKVITALQSLLGNQQKKKEQPPSILLTSYQHDAVDNMAQKTRVFGLPPYRYGSKDSQQGEQGFLEWRKEIKTHIVKQIEQLDSSPLLQDLRELKKNVFRLKSSNLPPAAYLKLLGSVFDRCKQKLTGFINLETLHKLEKVKRKITQSRQTAFPETIFLRRAVWALRTTPEGYADDGNVQLRFLADYLKCKLAANPDSLALDPEIADELFGLADNAEAITDEYLKRILKLKSLLLESLMKDPLWQTYNPWEEQLQNFLNSIISEINENLQRLPEGKADILEDFLENLNSNSLDVRETIAHYNLVYATTTQKSGAKHFLNIRSSHIQYAEDNASGFDYVIIDEAARANPLDLFIPMSLAHKKIILVGDHRQLPHLLEPEIEKDIQKITEKDDNLNTSGSLMVEALKDSLFKRMWEYFRSKPDDISRTVSLKTQYRMHPKLGEFISKVFYEPYEPDVKIEPGRKELEFEHTVDRYKNKCAAWEDCSGEKEARSGSGWCRPVEAEKVVSLAVEILQNTKESLGIITMYRAQEREIFRRLEDEGLITEQDTIINKYYSRLRVGTVDSFQGREFDVVLLSPVRSNNKLGRSSDEARKKFGFLTFENRLNVALSRQRKLLIVVGNSNMYQTVEAEKYVKGLYEFNKMCQGAEQCCDSH